MGGDTVALAPEAYWPALIVWALSIAWRAYRETKRADNVARERMLTEADATIRQLREEVRRAQALQHQLLSRISKADARVEIAKSMLEYHNLPTGSLTDDK